MCGICGVIHFDGRPVTKELLRAMNDRLRHRGPDGVGYFIDGAVGLAMRRLSIIDIAGSDQPLGNEDESVVLVFNGEIYNYRVLRRDLGERGHRFRSDGDGEPIAHLYEEYGDDCWKRLRGMYAIALWDKRRKRLLLARDRMGQKPLYYYHDRDIFVFASEIKALFAHPQAPRLSAFAAAEGSALAQYLSYGYLPAPDTAFQNIFALSPAACLRVNAAGQRREQRYWALPPVARSHAHAAVADHVEPLREKLEEAVKLRLMSDVPLGAFLSGGLDSSLIVALMRRHSSAPVKTFNIGFEGDDSFDETPYAEQVARVLGTEHHSFRVRPEAMTLLADLVWHHDQPFADSSAIPTYLVSKLTREQVTVALTGDGGDELFAGYERFYAASLFQRMSMLPKPLWTGLSSLLAMLPEGTAYEDRVKRARRFAQAAGMSVPDGFFGLARVFSADLIREIRTTAEPDSADFRRYLDASDDPVAGLLNANMRSYLPDDLLIKADRCSMAASLEARAPFLDHKLVEHAATIPFNLKLKGARTKFILKEAARGILPDAIIERRKHGFGIPLGAWLRRDMTPVRDILLSRRARERGLWRSAVVERLINEHHSGRRDHNRQLWALLTLEEWHRQFID
ncbi:MAG: asparagine synthase (glutamine-hydrolyzing) [Chloroflexota bacterium]|nr:asparagine synthase (glutamine-hydrolyzing) [Chloroflexota bacterium]